MNRLAARQKGLDRYLWEHKIEKIQQAGAGDGNRTRMTSLEGW